MLSNSHCRPSAKPISQQRLIAIWTVSSQETSGTEVQARCARQQQRVDADRWNFSAKSHPVRTILKRSGVCRHIALREATKKSEATTQIMAPHSDTFGVHDTPVLAPCANNRLTSNGMFVHPVTHASAPFSLARSLDPWKKTRLPLMNGSFIYAHHSSTQDDCSSS